MPSFSASDLRARVHSGFSAFELRKLLSSWGAGPEETEGDSMALAHRVVRLGYKRFGLGELIHKLRAEKPLLEWPDPGAEPDERWAGPPSLTSAAASGFTATPPPAEVAADTTVQMSERTLAETLGQAPTAPGPAATQMMEAVSPWTEGPWSARPPSTSVPPPSSRSQGSPPSRGLVFAEPEYFRRANRPPSGPSRAPLFIAIGAAVVAVAGVAFGAGWLIQSRRGEAPARASEERGAPAERRTTGPGGRAADVFDDGLRRVAETCGLDVTGTPTPEVFALAQEACGRDEFQRAERAEAKRRLRAGTDALDNVEPDPPPRRFPQDDPPLPARQQTPPRLPPRDADFRAAAPPAPKPVPTQSCTAKCSAGRDECSAGCGPEPNDASLYGAYQSCTSKCMSQETRCRRNCF